jgi:hypothetical protein
MRRCRKLYSQGNVRAEAAKPENTLPQVCPSPANGEAAAFVAAGYTELQITQIALAIAVKTLSNYSNHIFHNDVDAAFEAYKV